MASCLLYVGTNDGMFIYLLKKGSLELIGRGLKGNAVRGIAIHPQDPRIAYIACGLRGWGLHRTRDVGRSFELLGFEDRWVWDVAFHPNDPKTLYVGTEPPMLYVSRDEGRTFRALEGLEKLTSRPKWKFFHAPFYAGHVHGIAIHPERPARLFAGVEHGAFIYSYDGGRRWQEALVGCDIHRVTIAPADPDRVFVGAGDGLFMSEDAGRTWQAVAALSGKYIHAVLFDGQRPQMIYVYAAQYDSPLYRSEDGGRSWHAIGRGLPQAGPADNLSRHPSDPDILFYAGDVGEKKSQVYVSLDSGMSWHPLDEELPKIWRLRT